MIEGLYQSEENVYYRDQEYFYHYLLFDGDGGVYNLTGKYDPAQARKIMTRSSKSIKGTVKKGLLSTILTIRTLSSGKSPSSDGSNIREYQLGMKVGTEIITIKNKDAKDYEGYSGIYHLVL